jgi:hypothetical protein
VPSERLLSGEQQTLGAAGLQLEFRLAQVLALVAGAHLAVVDSEFDLAILNLDVAGRALNNGSRQGFKSLTWTQIERSKSNPLPKLIDEAITREGASIVLRN